MAKARANRTAFAVLGYLTCWGPMSGYDIKKALEGSASNFWAESYGQIYPILKKLAEEGLARPSPKSDGEGRGRRVYEVTAAGRKALDAWLGEPAEPGPLRNEFLLKIFFGKRLAPEALRKHLETHRQTQQEFLQRYQELRRDLETGLSGHEDFPFWRMTLRYGERDRQAQIDWCNEALEELARVEASRTSPPSRGKPAKGSSKTARKRAHGDRP